MAASDYDLIILDWMMPGQPGIEFLAKFRAAGVQTPVLMLTGMNTTQNKADGLETGADDYLTKPFDTRELVARVRALLRRPQALEGAQIAIGKICLDTRSTRVTCNGQDIALTRQEYLLLEFLMRNRDQVFSAETLVSRAWSTLSESSPDTVRVHMSRLRKKLEAGSGEDCPIKTMHRVGYMFDSSGG